jgi:formate/nitrite transporter FocA (FNT family)
MWLRLLVYRKTREDKVISVKFCFFNVEFVHVIANFVQFPVVNWHNGNLRARTRINMLASRSSCPFF